MSRQAKVVLKAVFCGIVVFKGFQKDRYSGVREHQKRSRLLWDELLQFRFAVFGL
jgi:hypothetical protein